MISPQSEWQPQWSVSPGDILAEELETRGINQSELARRMGRPQKTINEIVNAKSAITPDTALQLEFVLGISAKLWLALESDYRTSLARNRALSEMEPQTGWARRFPLADLRRYDLIESEASGGELVAALLRFFGVGSVSAFNSRWANPVAAFRHSPSFVSDDLALAAWLRWGERLAADTKTQPFEREHLLEVLRLARPTTREEPLSDVLEELQELLAGCGVVLALTPGFAGTRVSGCTRWLGPKRALIQLSMRYKRDDQLWFTLYHEASHLLERRRGDYLDGEEEGSEEEGSEESEEARADQRARDLLIDPQAYANFVEAGAFTEETVRAFADANEIAPGIVVGRLQFDDHVGRSKLNHLKKPARWI